MMFHKSRNKYLFIIFLSAYFSFTIFFVLLFVTMTSYAFNKLSLYIYFKFMFLELLNGFTENLFRTITPAHGVMKNVFCSFPMVATGLKATRNSSGAPLLRPPTIPPALFVLVSKLILLGVPRYKYLTLFFLQKDRLAFQVVEPLKHAIISIRVCCMN